MQNKYRIKQEIQYTYLKDTKLRIVEGFGVATEETRVEEKQK